MKELLLANWEAVLGVIFLGGIGSLKVTRKVLKSVVLAGVHAFLTEDMLQSLILKGIEKYVKKTENKLDDEWFEKLKEELGK